MANGVKVSIYCLVYNQEKYVEKMINSLLNQKTDFKYEIIIHDDASTDSTPSIVRRYAEQYPDIIQTILQTQNQYSLQKPILNEIIPRMRGEYIAACEGDDYWCDSDKLQLQVDFLDKHPDCIMVAHNTIRIDRDGNEINLMMDLDESQYLYPKDLIVKRHRNPHFSSLMYRKILQTEEKPEFFKLTTGDNALRLFALSKGDVYCINRTMSAYRIFSSENSWTLRMKNDKGKAADFQKKHIAFLENYDVYTNGRFHDLILQEIKRRKVSYCTLTDSLHEALIRSNEQNLSLVEKLRILLVYTKRCLRFD